MAERDPSELELVAAFRAYLADAPTEVRAAELAHDLAVAHPRRRVGLGRWGLAVTPAVAWALLLTGLLLAGALIGALIAGGLLPPRPVTPQPAIDMTVTLAPSASPNETPSTAPASVWTSLAWSASSVLPDADSVAAAVPWNGSLIAAGYDQPDQNGNGSLPALWSSADGRDWMAVSNSVFDALPFELDPGGLVATSSGLVAYGRMPWHGGIRISRDGLWWEAPASFAAEARIAGIADGPNGLVAVSNPNGLGDQREAEIWTSQTGATWQRLSLDPARFPAGSRFFTVRGTPSGYLLGGCICSGSGGVDSAAAWWSSDGRTWQRAAVGSLTGTPLSSIHAGAGGLVAAAYTSDNGVMAWWSSDGHVWQPASLPGLSAGGNRKYAIYDDGSRMIAVSLGNSSFSFWTSTDGKSWQKLQVTGTVPDAALRGWTNVNGAYGATAVVVPDGVVLLGNVPGSSPTAGAWVLAAH